MLPVTGQIATVHPWKVFDTKIYPLKSNKNIIARAAIEKLTFMVQRRMVSEYEI